MTKRANDIEHKGKRQKGLMTKKAIQEKYERQYELVTNPANKKKNN